MDVSITIIRGNRYSKFRENEEIAFLKEIFGSELAKRYFYGFAKMSEWTLSVKQKNLILASASLKIYGGTLQISELVLPDGQTRLIKSIFENIESWAKNRRLHKIWLIDNPLLGRSQIYADNGFSVECDLKNNLYGQDEILYFKSLESGTPLPAIDEKESAIMITKGRKSAKTRRIAQLNQIKRLIGPETGIRYFESFRKGDHATLVVKADCRLVGSAALEIHGGVLTIETFILKKECRGKGIGTSALKTIEKYAKSHGCHKLQLITNPKLRVVELYLREGWKKEGYLQKNIANLDEIIMCKFL